MNPKADHRTERISEAIREEIAELVGYEMSDPRVASVIVTAVEISPDKRRALIRVAAETEAETAPALAALDHAKPFLKRELSARLDMYRIPELYFEADATAMLGGRLQHLFKRIRKGRPREDSEDPEKKAVE